MNAISQTPVATVIICTCDRRAWLAEAIASVEAQEDANWELIVVDDASADDTRAFLESGPTGRLRILREPVRVGRAKAANRGLEHARGEFVMFLDDDDRLRPSALSVLCRALRSTSEAVAAVGARWDWFCDGRGGGRRDSHPFFPRTRDIFTDLLFGWSAVSGQNLYRTDVVRRVGGYTTAVDFWPCDDRDLWLRVARCGPVVLRPEIVMNYRVHSGQWRPANLQVIRERVARVAVRQLPRAERRPALRVRRAAWFVQGAEQALTDGRFRAGLGQVVRAVRAAPVVWFSPLIGGWVIRRLLRRAWHRLRARS